jgi:sugar fermentation stimulation protein A
MRFETPLLPGTLVARYRRFLADVRLADGRIVTAHCPNTGSLLGCDTPGERVWLSCATHPRRKLAYTWELAEVAPGVLVGLHTGRANGLVEEAIRAGRIAALAGYTDIRREVRCGREASRIDLLLAAPDRSACYVEVKSVTAAVENGIGLFPDAVSRRAVKHLRELMHLAGEGRRAVLFFCAQRADVVEVRPADAIDPHYGRVLREAMRCGVEAMAWRAEVTLDGIRLTEPVPVVCP